MGKMCLVDFNDKEYGIMHIEEIILNQLQKKYPQYEYDFIIDDNGSVIFGLEEDSDAFYIKYLVEDDTWQVTMQTVPGNNQPEAYDSVETFEEALKIYFGHKNNTQ